MSNPTPNKNKFICDKCHKSIIGSYQADKGCTYHLTCAELSLIPNRSNLQDPFDACNSIFEEMIEDFTNINKSVIERRLLNAAKILNSYAESYAAQTLRQVREQAERYVMGCSEHCPDGSKPMQAVPLTAIDNKLMELEGGK